MSSCVKSDIQDSDTHGTFQASVNTDQASVMVKSSTLIPELTEKDYIITLENTRAEVLREWENITAMPELIKMVPGSYKLIASYGERVKLPVFDKFQSGAEVKFAVEPEVTIPVELNCSPTATIVSITFDPTFDDGYSNYEIALKTKGDSLNFTKQDQNRPAFFVEGQLKGRLSARTKDNPDIVYTYTYSVLKMARKAHHYKINFKPLKTSGELAVTITTDFSTIDTIISPTLPNLWLPKAPPIVYNSDWMTDGNGKMAVTQGKSRPKSKLVIETRAGIKSLTLKTSSQLMLDAGFPAEGYDLVNAPIATKNYLRKDLGLSWSDVLNDPAQAAGIIYLDPVFIDFERYINTLETPNGQTVSHPFTVEIEDNMGQSFEKPVTFDMEIAPPDIKVVMPEPYYIWSNNMTVSYITNFDRDKYNTTLEISTDKNTWITPQGEYDNNTQTYKIKGLQPGTKYFTRLIHDKHIIESIPITTEMPLQVPNSNFNDWNLGWFKQIPLYNPWKTGQSQYWATNSPRTACYAGATNQYNSVPAVVYHIRNADDRAAELRSVAGSGPGGATSIIWYDADRTAGRLLIGSLTCEKYNVETITAGRTHASRPKSIAFDYQYLPNPGSTDEWRVIIEMYNGVGGNRKIVGRGEYKEKHSANMAGFERETVNITYDENVTLAATHIYILYETSTAPVPPVTRKRKITPAYPELSDGSRWTSHWGSALRVDSLKLIYGEQ